MTDWITDGFALFRDAWLTAILLGALLPLLGIVLVLRRQMFLGAAMGQASALGFALALSLGPAASPEDGHAHDGIMLVTGALAAIGLAIHALRSHVAKGGNLEARSVVVFLLGACASMLALARDPHGLHEVMRLQSSSLLGASATDVEVAASLLLTTVCLWWGARAPLILWAIDPKQALLQGLHPARFDVVVGIWLGSSVAFALHATGLPYTFGMLVLPVLLARERTASVATVLWLAPVLGVAFAVFGLLLAHHPAVDWPPGQTVVALLATAIGLRALVHAVRPRRQRE